MRRWKIVLLVPCVVGLSCASTRSVGTTLAAGGVVAGGTGALMMKPCDVDHPCDSDGDASNHTAVTVFATGALTALIGACIVAADSRPRTHRASTATTR